MPSVFLVHNASQARIFFGEALQTQKPNFLDLTVGFLTATLPVYKTPIFDPFCGIFAVLEFSNRLFSLLKDLLINMDLYIKGTWFNKHPWN